MAWRGRPGRSVRRSGPRRGTSSLRRRRRPAPGRRHMATCRRRRSGGQRSSLSSNARYRPTAIPSRAAAPPPPTRWPARSSGTARCAAANASRTRRVVVDPSSTTMHSKSANACGRRTGASAHQVRPVECRDDDAHRDRGRGRGDRGVSRGGGGGASRGSRASRGRLRRKPMTTTAVACGGARPMCPTVTSSNVSPSAR